MVLVLLRRILIPIKNQQFKGIINQILFIFSLILHISQSQTDPFVKIATTEFIIFFLKLVFVL